MRSSVVSRLKETDRNQHGMALVSNVPVASGMVLWTISLLTLFYIIKFFYRLYRVRSSVRNVANKHSIVCIPISFSLSRLVKLFTAVQVRTSAPLSFMTFHFLLKTFTPSKKHTERIHGLMLSYTADASPLVPLWAPHHRRQSHGQATAPYKRPIASTFAIKRSSRFV